MPRRICCAVKRCARPIWACSPHSPPPFCAERLYAQSCGIPEHALSRNLPEKGSIFAELPLRKEQGRYSAYTSLMMGTTTGSRPSTRRKKLRREEWMPSRMRVSWPGFAASISSSTRHLASSSRWLYFCSNTKPLENISGPCSTLPVSASTTSTTMTMPSSPRMRRSLSTE